MVIAQIFIMLMTVVLTLVYVLLLLGSKKYESMIAPLDNKEFVLKDCYGVGLSLLEMIHFDYRSKASNDLRDSIRTLYGDKYAEYYLRIAYAQRISLTLLSLWVCLIFACFASGTDGMVILGLGLVVAGVVYYYFRVLFESRIKKRSSEYLRDFPDAISTIALLVNSGMMLREAWTLVASSGDKPLYKQMYQVTEEMNNGKSEADALYAFSIRCASSEIKKFTAFIIQGLEKGNRELSASLRNQSNQLWEEKRQLTLQQGEAASSKLLIPIFVMFIGILIMIMGPIMTNLGI